MITSLTEYYQLLCKIQNENAPDTVIQLPSTEPMLQIDLNARTIESPEYLSVATDHRSETIFFKVNRYFDNVDLSTMSCVIQFINAAGESGLYVVPFYDIVSLSDTDEMIIPWVIEGIVTAKAGTVTYAIQFFRIAENAEKYEYNLNTLAAKGKVLQGNDFDHTAVVEAVEREFDKTLADLAAEGITIDFSTVNSNLATAYELLIDKMHKIDEEGKLDLYWINL